MCVEDLQTNFTPAMLPIVLAHAKHIPHECLEKHYAPRYSGKLSALGCAHHQDLVSLIHDWVMDPSIEDTEGIRREGCVAKAISAIGTAGSVFRRAVRSKKLPVSH